MGEKILIVLDGLRGEAIMAELCRRNASRAPWRVWNRIFDDVRAKIIDLAPDCPEMSPRELTAKFSDTRKYYASEASVYRLLKPRDLITCPALIVIRAARRFSRQHNGAKPTLADQLHLFEGDRLGLVLSADNP